MLPADREQRRGFLDGWIFPSRTGGLHKGTNLVPVICRCLPLAGIERDLTAHVAAAEKEAATATRRILQ